MTTPTTSARLPQQDGDGEQAYVAPRLLWFGVIGAAIFWALHLIFDWGVVELACAQGHDHVLGMPLRTYAIVVTVIPLVVAVASFLVALAAARSGLGDLPDRRAKRAHFQAVIGSWMGGLSIAMIVFGGIAVLVLDPCAR